MCASSNLCSPCSFSTPRDASRRPFRNLCTLGSRCGIGDPRPATASGGPQHCHDVRRLSSELLAATRSDRRRPARSRRHYHRRRRASTEREASADLRQFLQLRARVLQCPVHYNAPSQVATVKPVVASVHSTLRNHSTRPTCSAYSSTGRVHSSPVIPTRVRYLNRSIVRFMYAFVTDAKVSCRGCDVPDGHPGSSPSDTADRPGTRHQCGAHLCVGCERNARDHNP